MKERTDALRAIPLFGGLDEDALAERAEHKR